MISDVLTSANSMRHQLQAYLCLEIDGDPHRVPIEHVTREELTFKNTAHMCKLARERGEVKEAALWICGQPIGTLAIAFLPASDDDRCITARSQNMATTDLLWQAQYQQQMRHSTHQNGFELGTIPRVPQRGQYTEAARLERLAFTREATGAALSGVGTSSLDARQLQGNLESYIGSVEVPIGVAGPLQVNGQYAQGVFYAPIATTEGALVASITRGARALTGSGGVTTYVMGQRVMRVPLFVFSTMHQAIFFAAWMRDHFDEIKAKTQEFSNFANLIVLEPQIHGKSVHVHFVFETGDASGQNMVTNCTWNTCLWLIERLRIYPHLSLKTFMIEGLQSGEKTSTFRSFLNGRGIHVQAEAFLPEEVLVSMLKVTAQQLFTGYQGMAEAMWLSGTIGFNLNVGNVLAGIYTATGQDIACLSEGTTGQLYMELTETGLYASMTLPNLVVGTIGGGTGLPQQHECLEMLGCAGTDKAWQFAEIIAAYCLALDLSTASALVGGQFAVAHERLGRNRPVQFLTYEDLHPAFFNEMVVDTSETGTQVTDAVPLPHIELGSSILTELSADGIRKLVGHFPYRFTFTTASGERRAIDVMIKSKPTDREVIQMIGRLASLCGAELAAAFKEVDGQLDLNGCHVRELMMYAQQEDRFRRYVPEVYGVYRNDDREIYLLVLECLQDMILMDSADNVSGWAPEHIVAAIDGIADIHSIWLGRDQELKEQHWLQNYPTCERMLAAQPLWKLLAVQAHQEFPQWFQQEALALFRAILADMPRWWQHLETLPKTLIHNDFNPRNIAFRRTSSGLQLCVYDWELATLNVPQHDLAELLVFVLDDRVTLETVVTYVEHHRQALERASGQAFAQDDWWHGFCGALKDLMINRIAMYMMAHTARHYDFMERVYRTLRHLITLIQDEPDRAHELPYT